MANYTMLFKQVSEKRWQLLVNGRLHGSDFKTTKDAAEWLGNMQAHGLYEGASAMSESLGGTVKTIVPTYEYACHVPEMI